MEKSPKRHLKTLKKSPMAILERDIEKQIEDHLKSKSPAILIIEGARQVGKTTSIRRVGQSLFPNYVEVDLHKDSKGERFFEDVWGVEEFHMRLSIKFGEKLGSKDDTLVFLDGIDAYRHLVPMLKFLKEEGRYTYIASSSSFNVCLRRKEDMAKDPRPLPYIPMGAVRVVKMYPLSFKEFLKANGYGELALNDLKEHFESLAPLSEANHNRILTLFKRYLIIGGLPEPVSIYLDKRNIALVRDNQSLIRGYYGDDASQYDSSHSLSIKKVYDYLPSTMENKKKRVIYRDIEERKGAEKDDYLEEFDYLVNSGIALKVDAIASPSYPLGQVKKKNLLKLYLNDVGLLTNVLLGKDVTPILNEEKGINMGSIYETFVAMELANKGLPLYYYDNKRLGEVDYLIDDKSSMSVLPIEVKSGKDYAIHRAMDNIIGIKEYGIRKGYVLSNERAIKMVGKTIYLPIYFAMFIGEDKPSEDTFLEEITPYGIDG